MCLHLFIYFTNIYKSKLYFQIPQEGMLDSQYDLITEVKSFFSKLISCVHLDPSVFPREKFRLSAEYNRHKSYL